MASRKSVDRRWRRRQQLLVAAAFLQDELHSSSGRLMACATGTCNLMAATAGGSSSLPRALALLAVTEGRQRNQRLTNAVANPARFKATNRRKKQRTAIIDVETEVESDLEEDLQHVVPFGANAAERIEPLCDVEDHQFREHFGMDKHLLERLFREIHGRVQSLEDERPGHAFFNPSPRKILLTAWLLCTRESFRGVAERFGVSKGGVHVIFVNMCRLLVACSVHSDVPGFVQWPDDVTQKANAVLIEARTSLPGVTGCLGEMRLHETVKIGSKVSPTVVILQVVCDARQRFTDVYVSEPAMHPPATRIIVQTPLFVKLSSGASTCPGHHVIADASYPLMTSLLTPYSDLAVAAAAVVGREHFAYNRAHAAAMEVVDRTFTRLRTRFRRLDSLHMSRGDLVSSIIQAVCCLHNYIVQHEDVDDDDGGFAQPTQSWRESDDFSQAFSEWTPDVDAIFKRDRISQMLDAKAAVEALDACSAGRD